MHEVVTENMERLAVLLNILSVKDSEISVRHSLTPIYVLEDPFVQDIKYTTNCLRKLENSCLKNNIVAFTCSNDKLHSKKPHVKIHTSPDIKKSIKCYSIYKLRLWIHEEPIFLI